MKRIYETANKKHELILYQYDSGGFSFDIDDKTESIVIRQSAAQIRELYEKLKTIFESEGLRCGKS